MHQLAFSPHTDAKGIMDLVKFLSPKHVILVHGEKPKMASLKERIHSELGIQCYDPANNETICIPSSQSVKAAASDTFIQSCQNPNFKFQKCGSLDSSDSCSIDRNLKSCLQVKDERVAEGILVVEKNKKAKVVHQDELLHMMAEKRHDIRFAYCFPVSISDSMEKLSEGDKCTLLQILNSKINSELSGMNIQNFGENLQSESFRMSFCLKDHCPYRIQENPMNTIKAVYFCCSWSAADETLAWRILSVVENLNMREE